MENTLGNGYCAAGPQVLARFRSPPHAVQPFAVHRAGAGEMKVPEPKEAVIDRFRAALQQQGTGTGGWWQRQLGLCLIGIMATFGWEKALGDEGELAWWEAAAAATGQHIPIPR